MTTLISREPRLRVPHHPTNVPESASERPDKWDLFALTGCILFGIGSFLLALSALLL